MKRISKNYTPRVYNPLVLARLIEKYGFSKKYIQQCLRGDRKCQTADTLKKEYEALDKKIEKALHA